MGRGKWNLGVISFGNYKRRRWPRCAVSVWVCSYRRIVEHWTMLSMPSLMTPTMNKRIMQSEKVHIRANDSIFFLSDVLIRFIFCFCAIRGTFRIAFESWFELTPSHDFNTHTHTHAQHWFCNYPHSKSNLIFRNQPFHMRWWYSLQWQHVSVYALWLCTVHSRRCSVSFTFSLSLSLSDCLSVSLHPFHSVNSLTQFSLFRLAKKPSHGSMDSCAYICVSSHPFLINMRWWWWLLLWLFLNNISFIFAFLCSFTFRTTYTTFRFHFISFDDDDDTNDAYTFCFPAWAVIGNKTNIRCTKMMTENVLNAEWNERKTESEETLCVCLWHESGLNHVAHTHIHTHSHTHKQMTFYGRFSSGGRYLFPFSSIAH